MKSRILLFLLVFVTAGALAVDYPERPNPPKLVNDFTNTLSPNEVYNLEQKLVAFNDSTSVQIAVVILRSLDGYPASEYSFELAQRWGIGQKETNNGALLLIALDDHQLYIATGYGLEGSMPDAMCKRIIENDIKPFFKEQQYYQGIEAGTSQMMALVKGEYKSTASRNVGGDFPGILIVILFFLFIIVYKITSVKRYSSLNGIPFWLAWSLLNAARSRSRGSWGGFSGGGSSSSSSSSSSSFGGFGGGSFGGGGAGGSW